MKALIIEAYSAANIGSGALVENSVKLLKKQFPHAEIEILAQTPESINNLTKLPTYHEFISLPLGKPRIEQAFWLLKTALWMLIHTLFSLITKTGIRIPERIYTFNPNTLKAIERVRKADIVVSVGAERINDNFYKAIYFSLYMLWMVHCYGKFLVLFPQTIGPFHFWTSKVASKFVLNRCNAIYLRDQKSRDNITALGVDRPIIFDTCDVAVLQNALSKEKALSQLASSNIPTNKPIIGISVMEWTYIKAGGNSGFNEYKESISRVADELIEELGVSIVFLATNILVDGCREDDVTAAREIRQMMKNQDDAHIITEVYSPTQMKGVMGVMELCIVTRMHACIFSTGISTPTASINYQFKLHEYMKLMGLGDYTVDIDKVDYPTLKDIVSHAWNDRQKNRTMLNAKVESWSADLNGKMDQLPSLFEQHAR